MSSDPPLATIVMYHLVRAAGDGVLCRLKGLEPEEFRDQLNYLRRHYSPVDLFELADAVEHARPLPPNPIVLSFDDGYAGHYRIVFPMLAEAGVPAVFFLVGVSLLDRAVLDVNKIQCILAAAPQVGAVVERVEAAIERKPGLPSCREYRLQWWNPSRWDPPEVVYVKRLLQHALPEYVRRPLVDELFRALVSSDEAGFASELYMTADNAREMRRSGMTFGAHGDRHLRLSTLTDGEQAGEIDGSLRVLDAVGLPRRDFAFSYPNGDYNEASVNLLRARRCRMAVTTRPQVARVTTGALLTLPRIDTNDLPVR